MGSYVYALNTNVRTISGQTVGVAEYRYKESFGMRGDEYNTKWYNKLCARRVAFFENNPSNLPLLMTYSNSDKADTLDEGNDVYLCPSACFSDGEVKTKVGTLKKVGRSWTIQYIPNGEKIIQIAMDAIKARAERDAQAEKDWSTNGFHGGY